MSVRSPLGATQSGAFELRAGVLDAHAEVSRSRAGLVALGGMLATGTLVAVAAAHTNSLLPETERPMLRALAGPFGGAHINLHVGGVVAVLGLMFVSYATVVSKADRLSPRLVLTCIAALIALMALAPPLVSTDVFSYQAYQRMWALYGLDPYLHGPHAIQFDTIYPFIGARWVATPSAYGPVFTLLGMLLAPLSIAASAFAYKMLAAVASLTAVALVWHAAPLRGVNQVRAAALVGLNPLLVVYGVGGGHNDVLMVAAMAAGVYLILRHRALAGAGMLVLSAGIKLTAGLPLLFALAGADGRLSRSRRRDTLLGAGIGAAVLAAVGFAVFGPGLLHLFTTVRDNQMHGDWASIPGFLSTRLGLSAVGHATSLALAGAFALLTTWLLLRVWRGRLDWIDGAGWATAAMLASASALEPWYVAWLLPFAALAIDRRLVRVTLAMTGLVQFIQLLGYIPHGSSLLGL
jgi:alpha-1,6-mannosyltransferase